MTRHAECPACGARVSIETGPALTVDVLIESGSDGIVLVKRRFPPFGWAIPGGFVDEGESAEEAAAREALEETGLAVRNLQQFHVYSEPGRDPRGHTVSLVFVAEAEGVPAAGDDAAEARRFTAHTLPDQIAFDHREILAEYFAWRGTTKESG